MDKIESEAPEEIKASLPGGSGITVRTERYWPAIIAAIAGLICVGLALLFEDVYRIAILVASFLLIIIGVLIALLLSNREFRKSKRNKLDGFVIRTADRISAEQTKLAADLRDMIPKLKEAEVSVEFAKHHIDSALFEIKKMICRSAYDLIRFFFADKKLEFRVSLYEPRLREHEGKSIELMCEAYVPSYHPPITDIENRGFRLVIARANDGTIVWCPGIAGKAFLMRQKRLCNDIQDTNENPDFYDCSRGKQKKHWSRSSLMIPIYPSEKSSSTINYGVFIIDSSTTNVWNKLDTKTVIQAASSFMQRDKITDVTPMWLFIRLTIFFIQKLVEIYEQQYLMYSLIEVPTERFDFIPNQEELRRNVPL